MLTSKTNSLGMAASGAAIVFGTERRRLIESTGALELAGDRTRSDPGPSDRVWGAGVATLGRDHPFLKPTAAIFLKFFQISDFWHFIKLAITNEDGMLRIISLGAGVQSTTMAPMAAHGLDNRQRF